VEYKILPKSSKPVEVQEIRNYCTECGTKVKTNYKFCPSCGNKI
jgi:rRNA maturation endonuclease Nob1